MTDYRYMLDSDICIYLLRGLSLALNTRVAEQPLASLCISSISLAEVAIGFGIHAASAPELKAFLDTIPAVPFGEEEARVYATLPFRRARFDRLIAAHALALGLTLVTNNETDFADVPGLPVENWTRA